MYRKNLINKDEVYSNFDIFSTQGAAPAYSSPMSVQPSNLVTVYGSPLKEFQAVLRGDGYILQSNANKYTSKFDAQGFSTFDICINATSTLLPLSIISFETEFPNSPIEVSSTFQKYKVGEGHFKAINFTTQAPADGKSYCSIYIIADNDITISHVNIKLINSSMSIVGHPYVNATIINFNDDRNIEIQITSTESGVYRAYLSLDESPNGEYIPVDLMFLNIHNIYKELQDEN